MHHEVEREIVLDAAPDEVWRALTDPERMDGWLGEEAEIELEPGGELHLIDPVDGERTGWVEAVEPGRRLAVWWQAAGDDESTRVQFDIEERVDGTVLTVVETRPLADIEVQAADLRGPMALAA
jgi:uncharacterized protein YndB with AHSA1/START domain